MSDKFKFEDTFEKEVKKETPAVENFPMRDIPKPASDIKTAPVRENVTGPVKEVEKAVAAKAPKNVKEEVVVDVPQVVEPVVTETVSCAECQGDGKWDGVLCDSCKGSGKIFKDGTVVGTALGTFVFKGGKAIKA